ncbi:two component LuxR family transcriptional regulator [Caballeronia arvi]|uniref:Two component LuxR family transcriptional regulator n=1 Tax=Caballeronia arvi TaxID=1777135 RepID=A0A158L644_9BURK|nr:response regulator [Caballeronia arvi]SAL88489.1 two component LuxR family transcriptional regulator [Caballeronia arvi]
MKKILFVDDFKDTADALRDIATALGHEGVVAYDGASALCAAAAEAFDIIFLDSMLPDANGIDVCLEIRRGPSKSARIIALTGSNELVDKERHCIDDWVLKPLYMDELERLLS